MSQKDSLKPGLHPARLRHIRAAYEASKLGNAFIGHPSYDEQIAIIDALIAAEALIAEQDQRLLSYAAIATKNAADQRPVAWVPKTQLDLLRKGQVIVEADLSAVQRFDEVPVFTQLAQYPDDRDFFAWVNSDVDLSITLDDETYRGIAKAAWGGCIEAMRKKAGTA